MKLAGRNIRDVCAPVIEDVALPIEGRQDFSWSSYWTALYNAMTNKPSAAYSAAANTFVKTLVDGGVWAKLDRLFVFQAETNAGGEALLDWIHPTGTPAALAYGSGGSNPTFTANRGFTCVFANKQYISTQYNPSTNGSAFKLDDASLGFYFRKLNLANTQLQMGVNVSNGQNYLSCSPRYNALTLRANARFYSSCNITAGQYTTGRTQDFTGIYGVIRYDSGHIYQCRNNTLTSIESNSVAIPNGIIDIGRNYTYYTDGEFSMAWIGGALTQTDMTLLVSAYESFRDGIDATIMIMGDSTVGDNGVGMPAISTLMDNDSYAITDFAQAGETIALQKARFVWHTDEYLAHIKCMFLQIGLNDYTMTTPQILAAYQDLVDTVRSKISATGKIVGVTMIPCNRSGDQQWIDLNAAIRGKGASPITGLDAVIDTVATALNDGSNGLAAAYDSGDHLHENADGRQLIADLYDAQLTAFGL